MSLTGDHRQAIFVSALSITSLPTPPRMHTPSSYLVGFMPPKIHTSRIHTPRIHINFFDVLLYGY